jgi:NodT family efflux transporter outer membrane factor (OMF) lipoprotein
LSSCWPAAPTCPASTSQAKLRDADSLGLKAAPFSTGTSEVDARWWLGFGDAQLDALVDEALAGSPNIAVARARLSRAQAAIATAESADRPQLNGSLDATRQKFSSNYIYPAPLAGSIQEVGTLQLNGSWEIDFFGKNRAALDSALGSSNAAAAEVDAARILLASNVARGYIQWARLNDQLTVARRTLAQRGETLQLVRDRVSAGLDTRLELRQSEGGLPEARQQIEALDEQIASAQHALDALVARPDATRSLTPPSLASIARPSRSSRPSRPTCSGGAPTSRRHAGASRPPRMTSPAPRRRSTRTSTCRRSSACPASGWAAC